MMSSFTMKGCSVFLLSALFGVAAVSVAKANIFEPIDAVDLSKEQTYVKNSSGAPVVDTSNPFGSFGFNVDISGPDFGSGIVAPTVVLPSGSAFLGSTSSNGGKLVYNSNDGYWEYGTAGNDIAVPTKGILDSDFASGLYKINLAGNSFSLNLTTPGFPAVPDITFSQGTWSNGVLLVDPTKPLTITTTVFDQYTTAGMGGADGLALFATDSGNEVFLADNFSRVTYPGIPTNESGNFATDTIAANTLLPDTTYSGFSNFNIITDYNTTGGSFNIAGLESFTGFTISAIPEPSAYAVILSITTLGFATIRVRRKVAQKS